MIIRVFQNASIDLTYAGVTFLINPVLGEEETDAEYIILTNAGSVKISEDRVESIDREKYILTPDEEFAQKVKEFGFTNVHYFNEESEKPFVKLGGVQLIRTDVRSENGECGALAGIGLVVRHPKEDTLYLTGRTAWCDAIEEAVTKYKPQVVASMCESVETIQKVHELAQTAMILDCNREIDLPSYAAENGFSDNLLCPDEGEMMVL